MELETEREEQKKLNIEILSLCESAVSDPCPNSQWGRTEAKIFKNEAFNFSAFCFELLRDFSGSSVPK